MRHENEVSDNQMNGEQKQQRQYEADYDTFMGTVGEIYTLSLHDALPI